MPRGRKKGLVPTDEHGNELKLLETVSWQDALTRSLRMPGFFHLSINPQTLIGEHFHNFVAKDLGGYFKIRLDRDYILEVLTKLITDLRLNKQGWLQLATDAWDYKEKSAERDAENAFRTAAATMAEHDPTGRSADEWLAIIMAKLENAENGSGKKEKEKAQV